MATDIHLSASYPEALGGIFSTFSLTGFPDLGDPLELTQETLPCAGTDVQKEALRRAATLSSERAEKALDCEARGRYTDAMYYWNLIFNSTLI
jgi:hypothetical protein